MSEIERIRRYVEREKIRQNDRYGMNMIEGVELSKAAYESGDLPLEIIVLAFNYGRAKGYREAKAESRNAAT